MSYNVQIESKSCKKIFILEDDPIRVTWFAKTFQKRAQLYFLTHDYKLAIEELKVTKYDLIFLDHDLDELHYGNANPKECVGTGYDVARTIPEGPNGNTPVIVHSLNPVGAHNMCCALDTAVHIPFYVLLNTVRYE